MTEAQIELSRRLVAHPSWPYGRHDDRPSPHSSGIMWRHDPDGDWYPNLTDNATGGVLLGMLSRRGDVASIVIIFDLAKQEWDVRVTRDVLGGVLWDDRQGSCLGEAAGKLWLALQEVE